MNRIFSFYRNSLFIFPGECFCFAAQIKRVSCLRASTSTLVSRVEENASSVAGWYEESCTILPDKSLKNDSKLGVVSRRSATTPFSRAPFRPESNSRRWTRKDDGFFCLFLAARETRGKMWPRPSPEARPPPRSNEFASNRLPGLRLSISRNAVRKGDTRVPPSVKSTCYMARLLSFPESMSSFRIFLGS